MIKSHYRFIRNVENNFFYPDLNNHDPDVSLENNAQARKKPKK